MLPKWNCSVMLPWTTFITNIAVPMYVVVVRVWTLPWFVLFVGLYVYREVCAHVYYTFRILLDYNMLLERSGRLETLYVTRLQTLLWHIAESYVWNNVCCIVPLLAILSLRSILRGLKRVLLAIPSNCLDNKPNRGNSNCCYLIGSNCHVTLHSFAIDWH